MRVGQKNKLTYCWARTGSRPRTAHDQRTQSTYLFGAVCPQRGAGAALVLPACNTEAMQLHLDEIATRVAPGAHAILLLDQAGWHGPQRSRFQAISPSCRCRRAHPNSIPKKTFGSSCVRTGFPTASSKTTTTSSITAATPGTPLSISPGKSCPSPTAIGRTSVTHCEGWYKPWADGSRSRVASCAVLSSASKKIEGESRNSPKGRRKSSLRQRATGSMSKLSAK